MPHKRALSPIAAVVAAATLLACLTAGALDFLPLDDQASGGETACALGVTTGDPGTGDPYPDRGDVDGSANAPFPLGATAVCTAGGTAWTVALEQPIFDAGAGDYLDTPESPDSDYIVLPARASYLGTATSVVTDDLQFSYLDSDNAEHVATAEPARTDSLFDFPRVFPNGVATGSVVIAVPKTDDDAGQFVVTVVSTGQTVHFSL